MSKDKTISLRAYEGPMDGEEREFFGLEEGVALQPQWPEKCVNCTAEQAGKYAVMAERKGDVAVFHVPLCAEHRAAKDRRYGWVTTLGLWIIYSGIIAFSLSLYFAFNLAGSSKPPGNLLFLLSLLSLATVFFGFYFVKLMERFSPAFRGWLEVPAVRIDLLRSTPYFRDVSFRFGNERYAAEFEKANRHLALSEPEKLGEKRIAWIEGRLAENVADTGALFALGVAHERLGNHERSIATFERLLELEPDDAGALRHLGAVRLAAGRAKEAESALSESLRLDTGNPDTLLILATLYEVTNRFDHAADHLTRAAEAMTEDPAPLRRLGDLHLRRGEFETAIEAYERALLISPDDKRSLTGLGMARIETGAEEGIDEIVEKLRTINPEMAERLRAVAYEIAGRKKKR